MLITTHTTGIHCTDQSIEWTVLRKKQADIEQIKGGTLPVPPGFFKQEDAPIFPAELLRNIHRDFRGVVTASIPTSRLLMRVLELPSTDPEELQSMVELQLDQISPYSLDQMATSYELLHEQEDHSRVLAVATQRPFIDQLGDLLKEQHVYIRSLDAEILAWWSLLDSSGSIPADGRAILILEAHSEFSIIVTDNGIPVCFRSLEIFHDFSAENIAAEIAEEIRYTLLSLETEYGADADCRTEIWSRSGLPAPIIEELKTISPRGLNQHDLDTLPSLAEGLAHRSADRSHHHMELVPREWVDVQRRRKALKISAIASAVLMSLWLLTIAGMGLFFAIHKASVTRIRNEHAIYLEPANAARAAQAEKNSLEKFADRSHSALECLREITELLPNSLELNSFNYTKGRAIALRGSGQQKQPIYSFWEQLGASPLFEGIKNEKQGIQVKQGKRREGFSVTVELPELSTGEDTP